jgi:signal transduction histidine kinase
MDVPTSSFQTAYPPAMTLRAIGAVLLLAGLGLAVTALVLRPGSRDLIIEGLCLLISGLLAFIITAITRRLVTSPSGGLRIQLSLPHIVATTAVALPLIVAVPLMFESRDDATYLLVLLAFGVAVSLILASAVARSLMAALLILDSGAQCIARGDYATRLPEAVIRRGDELGRLGRSFNTMAECVQQAFISQHEADVARRQLIAAISHDLRTPLSSLRAMVEAMTDGVVTDQVTINRYLHAMCNEARHLSALIDDLFEFSRLEVGGVTLKRELTGLDDLLSDTLEAMQVAARKRGVRLVGELWETLPPVWIDARLIQRVLYNLVENAIRYTPSGGQVTLSAGLVCRSKLLPGMAEQRTRLPAGSGEAAPLPLLPLGPAVRTGGREDESEEGKEVIVEVRDSGEGIPAADLPHIFEPFYRGERARTRQVTHSEYDGQVQARYEEGARAGLGLTIARHIITLHGGRLWAISPARGAHGSHPGTSFFFTLPLVGSAFGSAGD